MDERTIAVLRRGIECAVIASIPQVLLPKLEEHLFLHTNEDADLGPRFIDALADHFDVELPEDMRWIGASAFHFAYAVWWGAAYSLAQEKLELNPWVGGIGLSALLHLVTFPSWGGAVLTGAEKHPKDRSWQMELVLATAPTVFGLGTALLYGRGPKRYDTDL